jgi:hypothetical protein
MQEDDPNDMNYSPLDLGPTTGSVPTEVQERPKKRSRVIAEVVLPAVRHQPLKGRAHTSTESPKKHMKSEPDDEMTTSLTTLRNVSMFYRNHAKNNMPPDTVPRPSTRSKKN